MKTGRLKNYQWVEFTEYQLLLVEDIIESHIGMFLHIASFEGDPISPTEEAIKQGWQLLGKIMVSPPIDSKMEVPYDGFDEWYFFEEPTKLPDDIEIFINYGNFSLVPVDQQLEEFDPTWESDSLDWLRPIQQRFWSQASKLNPETYVSIGDKDIIVTKNGHLLDKLCKNA